MTDIFVKQDTFIAKMIGDCGSGELLEPIFRPFFDWLCDRTPRIACSKVEAYKMMAIASTRLSELSDKHPHAFDRLPTCINDDPWQNYEGMKEDKYVYSYYAYIEDEITKLIAMGYFNR